MHLAHNEAMELDSEDELALEHEETLSDYQGDTED